MPSSTLPAGDHPSGPKPFWEDAHLQLWGGDCREVLRELPAESVHCVVTSPPYWGLRDYGTAAWEGGDEACDHQEPRGSTRGGPASTITGGIDTTAHAGAFRDSCRKCGATRIDSQLGLEPTPEEYVANMVAVFREVRRVLRRDGTLWLNLGDSYAGGGTTGRNDAETIRAVDATSGRRPNAMAYGDNDRGGRTARPKANGLKPKDLVGIPWRVAFALQADGWYLRSDIIWSKPNPMPESVTDRPTKAHEYLFLLSRSPRYYYDAEAVREAGTMHPVDWNADGTQKRDSHVRGEFTGKNTEPGKEAFRAISANRNLRSVWTIATEPYPGAHFATFPRKLVEPCVKAGTSEKGVCPECGAPWVRVVERERVILTGSGGPSLANGHGPDGRTDARANLNVTTTGWQPSCHHNWIDAKFDVYPLDPVPAVVLDPFAGSGTTLLVAQQLGRRGIGIDLSPEYLKQALARNAQTPLGLVG